MCVWGGFHINISIFQTLQGTRTRRGVMHILRVPEAERTLSFPRRGKYRKAKQGLSLMRCGV